MPRSEPRFAWRTGVLIVTVSAEAAGGELRLRVASNSDVIAGVEQRYAFTQPKEVLQFVRNWLAGFGDATVTASARHPVSVVRQELPELDMNPGRKGE